MQIYGPQATGMDQIRPHSSSYVNVNNHYEGSAPLTIQRLLEILRHS